MTKWLTIMASYVAVLLLVQPMYGEPSFLVGANPQWVVLSSPVSPRVAVAFDRKANQLAATLSVAHDITGAEPTDIALGVAARRHVVLNASDARVTHAGDVNSYVFAIDAERLIDSEDDWRLLRFAVSITWRQSNASSPARQERFHHSDRRATFTGLAPSPADWATFDLAAYEKAVVDARELIAVDFQQPVTGKATIIIEDSAGRRLRNLVRGWSFDAGPQRVQWDGLTDDGQLVAPGTYRWRGATHAGITPRYLMRFANGDASMWQSWGPNHSTFQEAATNGKYVFLAAPITEGGHALVALNPDGSWVNGYRHMHGLGIERSMIAADDTYLYVVQDGHGHGRRPTGGDWVQKEAVTLVRYNIETGAAEDFEDAAGKLDRNRHRYIEVDVMPVGPGSGNPDWHALNLTGVALVADRLYIACRYSNAVFIHSTATGESIGRIELSSPGRLAAMPEGRVLAMSENRLVIFDAAGAVTPFVETGDLVINGLTAGPDGRIYISDGASHQVVILSSAGDVVQRVGQSGGLYAGAYVTDRMVNPAGLTIAPDGKLWVVEQRWNPKRVLAWDVNAQHVAIEMFGSPKYGGPGTTFDPQDDTRIIADQCLWKVDPATGSSWPTHVLQTERGLVDGCIGTPLYFTFHRQGGRTFLVATGKATVVSELRDDGTLRDIAALGGTTMFAYACNWRPPPAYVEAYYRQFPQLKPKDTDKPLVGRSSPINTRGLGAVLWVDRNGDGTTQVDEFTFAPAAPDFSLGYWGSATYDLNLFGLATVNDQQCIVHIAPDGFDANGVPCYPTLAEAIAHHSTPITGSVKRWQSSMADHFGRIIFNADPDMIAFAADGSVDWSMPNGWSGVHGSHRAPLPETGVMQGNLYFLGNAPFDDRADVTMLNGNHGRFFVMTTDGLYLDEMFRDVRQSRVFDNYTVGGEPFGGYFGKSQADGTYYLHAANYRLYRIDGIDNVARMGGTIEVTAHQLDIAREKHLKTITAERAEAVTTVTYAAKPPKIDGTARDWRTDLIAWDEVGQYPVRARATYDEENLYLFFEVMQDESPWINHGSDWTNLFRSGDSINLEIGLDGDADPKRREPAPGDVRLVIAPFGEQTAAVLYRYVAPGGANPIVFASPTRAIAVDSVTQLEGVTIAMKRDGARYSIEAAIPLAALGMDAPSGKTLHGDFGVNYGDVAGEMTRLRSFWSNKATALVNDVPSEIALRPNLWGTIRFEARP